MAESNHVVVHYNDGRVVKGTTHDFNPNKTLFHILPADGGKAVEIQCRHLKAVFFVKTLEGNPGHRKHHDFKSAPAETLQGKKIAVLFKDGELICGYTLAYTPGRLGFFVSPSDPGGNNERIFVIEASAAKIVSGPKAETFVDEARVTTTR